MKKALSVIALAIAFMSPLMAAQWTLALDGADGYPQLIDADGDSIALDSYIWLKRWNGFTLDRVQGRAYLVTDEDGYSIIVFLEGTDVSSYMAERTLELYADGTDAMIFLGGIPDADLLEDIRPTRILYSGRVQAMEERRLERLGFSLERIESDALIDMDDGRVHPIDTKDEDAGYWITCPFCHRGFGFIPKEHGPFRPHRTMMPETGYDEEIANPWA